MASNSTMINDGGVNQPYISSPLALPSEPEKKKKQVRWGRLLFIFVVIFVLLLYVVLNYDSLFTKNTTIKYFKNGQIICEENYTNNELVTPKCNVPAPKDFFMPGLKLNLSQDG